MSCLEKLLIAGIRSFHPDKHQVIDFRNAPVTLIVGQNGSGKTTIIEVLKFVTTGQFPPNAGGQAWLYDPKILKNEETKALIRLKFRDQADNKLQTTRRLMVTQKKSSMTYKAMESTISKYDAATKSKTQITSRCADVTEEMLVRLGVSAAVLSNVIFCHQEESNWPLSAPTELKKKFDEIFSATRYIKALDCIKKTKTEHDTNLKLFINDLQYMKEKKEKAVEIKSQYKKQLEEYDSISAQIADLEKILGPIQEEIKAAKDHEEKLQRVQTNIVLKKKDKKHVGDQLAQLKNTMVEMSGVTDAELFDKRTNFEQNQEQKTRELRDVNHEKKKLVQRQGELKHSMDKLMNKLGALQNAEKANDQRIQQRNAKIREVSIAREINGYDGAGPFSDSRVEAFVTILIQMIDTKNSNIEAQQGERDKEDKQLQRDIDAVRVNIAQTRERLATFKNEKTANEASMKTIQQQLNNMEAPQETIEVLQAELKEHEQALEKAKEDLRKSRFDERLKGKELEATQCRTEIKLLENQLQKVLQQSKVRNHIEQLEISHKQGTEQKDRLWQQDEAQLKSLLGDSVRARKIVSQYENVHTTLSNECREYDEIVLKESSRVAQREESLKAKERKLNESRNKSKHSEKILKSKCAGESYESARTKAVDDRDEAETKLSLGKQVITYLKMARESNCCRACKRKFTTPDETEAFIGRWQKYEKDIAGSTAEDLQQERNAADQHLQDIIALEDKHKELDKLKNSIIPDLDNEIKAVSTQVGEARTRLEDAQVNVKQKRMQINQLEQLRSHCEAIQTLTRNMEKIEKEIKTEKDKLFGTVDANETIESLRAKVQDQQRNLDKCQHDKDLIRQERDEKTHQVGVHDRGVHHSKLSISDFKLAETERLELNSKMQHLELTTDDIEEKISSVNKLYRPQQDKLDQAIDNQKEVRKKWKQTIDKLEEIKQSVIADKDNIKRMNIEIRSYLRDGKSDELVGCKKQLKEASNDSDALAETINDLIQQANDLQAAASTEQVLKRQIEDNIAFRRLTSELKTTNIALEKFEKEKKEISLDAPEVQVEQLKADETKHTNRKSQLQGSRGALHRMIQDLMAELNSPMYKEANTKHRAKLIEAETTRAALKDLQTYYNALDQAVVQFHKIRMKEINDVIRELWESTYRGGDIDYIEILSDEEKTTAEGKKVTLDRDISKRKSYKYRVVMVKGGVKIDMRGRCSAGQKVLASIIIRLALADTFCLSCGVFTLDEPTTNLDADNIDSLAEALSKIIRARSEQHNFQMIIITHDEKFAQKLGRNGIADTYYHISKEPEQVTGNLVSKISSRKIREMQVNGDEAGNDENEEEF